MTNQHLPHLGLGIGWRPELALPIDRRGLGFVELVAEDFAHGPLPAPIESLRRRGVKLVPHGLSLSLGGAEPPDRRRLDALASLAERVEAPLVSEHIAFVRGGGRETGHLLPLPRTQEALEVIVANAQAARAALPVPLALENVANLFEWPDAEMDEAAFLTELLERADVLLLLDLENVYANAKNHGFDPARFLDRIPLERIAYVHVAGGIERAGLYHDTHAHAVPAGVLELLEELCGRTEVPGVMLERDDRFPSAAELKAELDAIAAAMNRGAAPAPGAKAPGFRGGKPMSPSAEARERLADQQAALAAALLVGGDAPAGFDAGRLRAAATALARKRMGAVARAWPDPAVALGPGFRAEFAAYAQCTPLPKEGGPLADGRRFARRLAALGKLPEAGRLQALAVDLRFVLDAAGLRPRRGPALRLAWLRQPHRLLVALRAPWLGEWWGSLPMGW